LLCASAQEPVTLKLTKTIPLPGVKGRFDHFAIDLAGQRLFVAALGNNTLEIIDLASHRVAKSISGMSKPQGVAYLPDRNLIAIANGERGSLEVLDDKTYVTMKSLAALDDADNVRYDSEANVWVGFGDGALARIDLAKLTVIGQIKLSGHPESFQLEKQGTRIFVNVPDANEITVANRQERKVLAHWPLKDFKANFPMALDESSHHLLVGCRFPARLLVLDSDSGKILGDVEIHGDTDDLFFDAKRKLIYASCGEGFVDIIATSQSGGLERLKSIPTATGARTSFYSLENDLFYLAVPAHGTTSAEIRIYKIQ
jgi:YVTN family beta-propeller protein